MTAPQDITATLFEAGDRDAFALTGKANEDLVRLSLVREDVANILKNPGGTHERSTGLYAVAGRDLSGRVLRLTVVVLRRVSVTRIRVPGEE
jgi:hypothetical protein